MDPIIAARKTIQCLTQYAEQPASTFRVVPVKSRQGGSPEQAIKVNSLFWKVFYSLRESWGPSYKQKRQENLLSAAQRNISFLSPILQNPSISECDKVSLFYEAKQFNQALENARVHEGSLLAETALQGITIGQREVDRELSSPAPTVDEIRGDPTDVPDWDGSHFRYPGDRINHDAEATRIFKSTQWERVKSNFYSEYKYFRNGVTEKDLLCTTDAPFQIGQHEPSSYWIGHSSCLMSIPVCAQGKRDKIKTLHVLTDPIEGSPLLPSFNIIYPRQTRPAKTIEELPSIDVVLLSHNHPDHFDTPTLRKLVPMQPIMIVSYGDGKLLRGLGFKNVYEQKWWDTADITIPIEDERYPLQITSTPSHHWAGRGTVGRGSYFDGFVIRGSSGGDIYYAGDTARLNADHLEKLRQRFDIRWMYQPGGPDEMRADMKSTHQSSADSLWMHTELFFKKIYRQCRTKAAFMRACTQRKTLLMHTSTFKLGNLHADDTKRSIQCVVEALEQCSTDGTKREFPFLCPHEQEVLDEILAFRRNTTFEKGKTLSPQELANLFQQTVYVPKIGSRIDFNKNKSQHEGRLQF